MSFRSGYHFAWLIVDQSDVTYLQLISFCQCHLIIGLHLLAVHHDIVHLVGRVYHALAVAVGETYHPYFDVFAVSQRNLIDSFMQGNAHLSIKECTQWLGRSNGFLFFLEINSQLLLTMRANDSLDGLMLGIPNIKDDSTRRTFDAQ